MVNKLFFLFVIILISGLVNGQSDINYYGSNFITGGQKIIPQNEDGNFVLATREFSSELIFLEDGTAHFRVNSGLLLTDSIGEILVEHKFNTGYQNVPDTNYYIEEIAEVNGDVWVLLRSNYFEEDTLRWEHTELLQYSNNLLELQQVILLVDSLNFGGYHFSINENSITILGNSKRDLSPTLSPNYITVKQYSIDSGAVVSASILATELTNSLPFPYNDLHFNPTEKEVFWMPLNGTQSEILTYSPTNGFNSQSLVPSGRFINFTTTVLSDRFIVAGTYAPAFGAPEVQLIQEFDFQYQLGYNQELNEEIEGKTLQINDIQQLPNGRLTMGVRDFPVAGSNDFVTGRILHFGVPGGYGVTAEVPVELEDNFYMVQHLNLQNGRYAIFGDTQIPEDSAVAVLVLTGENGVTSVDEQLEGPSVSRDILKANLINSYLELTIPQDQYPLQISITAMDGAVLQQKYVIENNPLEMGNLKQGTYVLKVINKTGDLVTRRFVKM